MVGRVDKFLGNLNSLGYVREIIYRVFSVSLISLYLLLFNC